MSSIYPPGNSDLTLTLSLSSPTANSEPMKPEQRGILLIQLLLKCVKHASSGNLHRADACLHHISRHASISGDSMQRVAAWFASALALRLVKRWPGLYRALNRNQPSQPKVDSAEPLLAKALPHLGFAYAIMTQTLTRAMAEERVIHIVDTGSADANLWVPILRSFSRMPHGPPHVKISCINSSKLVLEKMELRLVKEADASAMPFHFNPLRISLRDVTIDMLGLSSGEALAVVSVLNLHTLLAEDDGVDAHFGLNKTNMVKECKQMRQFLAMIRSISPKIVLLVEQEVDHNLNRLVDRFLEGLHYYSAIFDSMNTSCGRLSSHERLIVEEMYGREIENIVACEGVERVERHERYGRWMIRFGEAGFRPLRLWYECMEDLKGLMVGEYRENGYEVMNERCGLMLCWHQRPLFVVSAWMC